MREPALELIIVQLEHIEIAQLSYFKKIRIKRKTCINNDRICKIYNECSKTQVIKSQFKNKFP